MPGFPRALLSLSHAQKRRALGSRLIENGNVNELDTGQCWLKVEATFIQVNMMRA